MYILLLFRYLHVYYELLVTSILILVLFPYSAKIRHSPTYFPQIKKVKVTGKNKKGKKLSKTLKCAVTVKTPSIAMNQAESTIAVGETVALKATAKPASAQGSVTYTTSDEKVATVATDGTVTAVAAGEATITASAKCGTKTMTATAKVSVKKYAFKSVKQTKIDELTAEIAGATKDLKTSDVKITNTETKTVVPVKSVSVDANDATKVTIGLPVSVSDGKDYTVVIDETEQHFTATDGTVNDVAVTPLTIPYGEAKDINLVATDKNGIELYKKAYGQVDTAKYDFTITTTNGTTNESKLTLNKVGDTATAKVTYKSGKYTADGKPDGNIGPKEFTITAVEQLAVSKCDVRIGTAKDGSYDKAKDNKTVAIGDTDKNIAYFQIKDSSGEEVDYSKYKVESTDPTVLMVQGNGNLKDKKVTLVPSAKAGSAYLMIKKDDKLVDSIMINVVEKRAVSRMLLEKNSIRVSSAQTAAEKVKITFKDQYGEDIQVVKSSGKLQITSEGRPDGETKTAAEGYLTEDGTTNVEKLAFAGNGKTKGTYTYKIAYVNDGKEVCAQSLTAVVDTPEDTGTATLDLNFDSGMQKDVVVDKDNTVNDSFQINVEQNVNGILKDETVVADTTTIADGATANDVKTVKQIDYKITLDGKTKIDTAAGTTTCAGIQVSAGVINVDVRKANGDVIERLPAGNYEVTATVKTSNVTNAGDSTKWTSVVITKTFTVTDKTVLPANNNANDSKSLATANAQNLAMEFANFSYNDKTYKKDENLAASNIVAVEGTTSSAETAVINSLVDGKVAAATTGFVSGDKVVITKVTIKLPIAATGKFIQQEYNVNWIITIK